MAPENTKRLYQEAIDILDSRRRPQRPSEVIQNEDSSNGGTPGLRGLPGISGMERWLEITGYKLDDIDHLNIIHVAGTKGKGSTCAWIESFLRASGKQSGGFPVKTGLYTSPHLIHPEERIRVNFEPISREKFVEYFFQVWDCLSCSGERLPRYLQLLLLTALHTFKREGVEATVIETHHGGEFDSTNVFDRPVVAVVTPLGLDHLEQLGPTIDKIAWHKAGIFKRGCRALCSQQDYPVAVQVLCERAYEKGVELQLVGKDDHELPRSASQLLPEVQRANCALGLAAARAFLAEKAPVGPGLQRRLIPIAEAISQFNWPGRFQTIRSTNIIWYLDSAHNNMSIVQAADWYVQSARTTTALDKKGQSSQKRVVIFGQESKHRDSAAVLEGLSKRLKAFQVDYALFPGMSSSQFSHIGSEGRDFGGQQAETPDGSATLEGTYTKLWRTFHSDTELHYELSVESAMRRTELLALEAGDLKVLVTGSQILIGRALKFLKGGI